MQQSFKEGEPSKEELKREKEDITQLQQSILLRVSKQVLPPNTSIQKEAKEALQKATTVFINYLTATALDLQQGKKTLNSGDIFKALEVLELDASILGPVKEAVTQHQYLQKVKRDEYRKKKIENGEAMQVDGDELDEDADLPDEGVVDLKRQGEEVQAELNKKLKE